MKDRSKPEKFSHQPVLLVLLVVVIFVLALNQLSIAGLVASTKALSIQAVAANGDNMPDNREPATSIQPIPVQAALSVIPRGVPSVYGSELGVRYDDVTPNNAQTTEEAIQKLATMDRTITLTESQLQRYINIAGKISCEYCCGAPAVIFTQDTSNYKVGDAACGCAHSYAMRGAAKYLITKHGSEFTDDQILEEMGKWKTLFFPAQMTEKAKILQQQNIELNYINLASNKYREIEKGSGGGRRDGRRLLK